MLLQAISKIKQTTNDYTGQPNIVIPKHDNDNDLLWSPLTEYECNNITILTLNYAQHGLLKYGGGGEII